MTAAPRVQKNMCNFYVVVVAEDDAEDNAEDDAEDDDDDDDDVDDDDEGGGWEGGDARLKI